MAVKVEQLPVTHMGGRLPVTYTGGQLPVTYMGGQLPVTHILVKSIICELMTTLQEHSQYTVVSFIDH